jgi:hypothetical protein
MHSYYCLAHKPYAFETHHLPTSEACSSVAQHLYEAPNLGKSWHSPQALAAPVFNVGHASNK